MIQWFEMYGWLLFAVVSLVVLIFCMIRESRRRSYRGASIKFLNGELVKKDGACIIIKNYSKYKNLITAGTNFSIGEDRHVSRQD